MSDKQHGYRVEKPRQRLSEQPVDYITPNGIKVIKSNDPSPDACRRFIRILLAIDARNRYKANQHKDNQGECNNDGK